MENVGSRRRRRREGGKEGRKARERKATSKEARRNNVPAGSSFGHVNGHYLFRFRGMVKSSMRLEDLTIVPTQWPTFTRYSREMVGAAIDGIKRERFSMVLYSRVLYREYVDMDVVKIVKGSLQPVAIKVQTLFSITLPLPLME